MSNEKSVYEDPIKSVFCPICKPKVAELVEYIRSLENAVVVSKQAIESLKLLNDKQTKEKEFLLKERDALRDAVRGKAAKILQKRKDSIDNAYQRFLNRNMLIG